MAIYLAPAGIDDFSRSQHASDLRIGWHEHVSDLLSFVRDSVKNKLASPLFYDQIGDTSGVADSAPQPVPWNGFPLRLTKWFGLTHEPEANAAAEVVLTLPAFGFFRQDGSQLALPFRIQDEYCEWFVERGGAAINRISFTCEPPEYWEFLASIDFDLVHTLYEELLHTRVPLDDLRWPFDVFQKNDHGRLQKRYSRGDYNPWNEWNTRKGAVHLTHPANSLDAEVFLASDSTLGWPVQPNAQGAIDEIELMCCAGRGGVNRSSDPLIMKGVFGLARTGLSVALANPIGLYMSPFTLGGLLDPHDNPIGAGALKVVRQSSDGSRILRVEVAPPQNATYTLDQCTLDGNDLRFGGQIARGITMRLFGVAKRIPGKTIRNVTRCPQFCCLHPAPHTAFRGTFTPRDFQDCQAVTAEAWAREAFDIPPETLPAPHAAFLAAMREVGTPALQPRGRKIVAESQADEVALEEY